MKFLCKLIGHDERRISRQAYSPEKPDAYITVFQCYRCKRKFEYLEMETHFYKTLSRKEIK